MQILCILINLHQPNPTDPPSATQWAAARTRAPPRRSRPPPAPRTPTLPHPVARPRTRRVKLWTTEPNVQGAIVYHLTYQNMLISHMAAYAPPFLTKAKRNINKKAKKTVKGYEIK